MAFCLPFFSGVCVGLCPLLFISLSPQLLYFSFPESESLLLLETPLPSVGCLISTLFLTSFLTLVF